MKTWVSSLFIGGMPLVQRGILRLAVIWSAGAVLSACAGGLIGGPKYRVWQEEVKLNDGRVIVVTQKKRCEGAYTGGNYASCIAREAWLSMNLPEFSREEIVWHEKLIPIVVNIHSGRLYVVGFPPTGYEFDLYGKQRPPYLGFVYEGESRSWKRIPFADIPEGIYNTNMLLDGIPPPDIKVLTLKTKESKEMNGNPAIVEYMKRIDPTYKTNF
jgi:hypothetical protein